MPKGLPDDPRQNRLAVQVGDHALADLLYTDADKDIADVGWWQDGGRTERRLLFVLHGRQGSARYALIRTASDWLLHLTKDQPGQTFS